MNKNIYIAACDKNGGIYHFTQNDDGSLTEKNFYPLDRPLYMTVEKNKMYIILREPFDDDTNSGVMSFEIEKDGSLIRSVECESTEGKCACHLTVKDGNIYCVNYISGSVIKVGEKLVMNIGDGPNKPRQDKTHMHFVNFSPDEKYLLVTDLGLDTIFTYDKNLNEISRAKVPDGHGVRHLAYSGDGKYIFSANELASTVSVFSYNDGKLELIDTLSGIPSIVYGLFGMLFFVTYLKWGYSILAGAATLAIMVLPLIMRTTEEALLAVSDSYREASFGVGAGKLRTVFKIVLPAAMPGILSGVILAIGRIVGETAALIYTAGTVAEVSKGLLSSGRTLAIHMYVLSSEGLYTNQAYATAVVLLIFVLIINFMSSLVAKKFAAKD